MNIQSKATRPRGKRLVKDEVQVWLASLDIPTWKFEGLLAEDERKRAERFHFERDMNRFIVRRGILRILAGCYTGVEPESVRFAYEKNGKPSLANGPNQKKIFFSLSHSEGMAIYAFSRSRELGVDIERIRIITDMAKLIERFFSAREKAEWRALPNNQQKTAFFRGWTRKEAFVKASGDGLAFPLDGFDVTLAPNEPARLLRIAGKDGEASRWSLQDLRSNSGFAAALAVRGKTGNVTYRRWME
jgi:4'-phosphopantetheinyl transferase